MLNFTDSLFVRPILLVFMLSVAGLNWLVVRTSKWIENTYIKESPFMTVTPKPVRCNSLAALSVMAEAPVSCSPVRGCREGSVHTLWHTSDSMLAMRSLTSLCPRIVKSPFGQDSSCSTENWAPQ